MSDLGTKVQRCQFHECQVFQWRDRARAQFPGGGRMDLAMGSELTGLRVMPARPPRFGRWGERLALWLLNTRNTPKEEVWTAERRPPVIG